MIQIIYFYTADRARSLNSASVPLSHLLRVAKRWGGLQRLPFFKSELRLWLSSGSRLPTQSNFSKTSRQGLGPEAHQTEGLGKKSEWIYFFPLFSLKKYVADNRLITRLTPFSSSGGICLGLFLFLLRKVGHWWTPNSFFYTHVPNSYRFWKVWHVYRG